MTADLPADETNEKEPVSAAPFGPGFFLGQLGAFARARCPNPDEGLPPVEIHLATGEALQLCHVMGLAPAFVALAVHDRPRGDTGEARMRTEIVPYSLIIRVTIRSGRPAGAHVGFDLHHVPDVLTQADTPEEALRAAASRSTGTRQGGRDRD
jgi:hypothetical protein